MLHRIHPGLKHTTGYWWREIWRFCISHLWRSACKWSCGKVTSRLWYLICISTGDRRHRGVLNICCKKENRLLPAGWIKWSGAEPSLVLHSSAGSYQLWEMNDTKDGLQACMFSPFSEQLRIANVKMILTEVMYVEIAQWNMTNSNQTTIWCIIHSFSDYWLIYSYIFVLVLLE